MHLVARQATRGDFYVMQALCRPKVDIGDGLTDVDIYANWQTLWDKGNPTGVVLEDAHTTGTPEPLGLMMTVKVERTVFEEAVHSYEPYVLQRLCEDLKKGLPVTVSPQDIGYKNATDGVDILVCYLGWKGDAYNDEPAPSLRGVVANAYADRHGGYRTRSLFGEIGGHSLLQLSIRAGLRTLNDYEEWVRDNERIDHPKRPYLIGLTREEGIHTENFWYARMFTFFAPQFFFTSSQREILLLARDSYTDVEIAHMIGASSDAVKKRWAGIYERVNEVLPDLLPESPLGGRGVEKRRALLAHLRDRQEELRPYDRKASKG